VIAALTAGACRIFTFSFSATMGDLAGGAAAIGTDTGLEGFGLGGTAKGGFDAKLF